MGHCRSQTPSSSPPGDYSSLNVSRPLSSLPSPRRSSPTVNSDSEPEDGVQCPQDAILRHPACHKAALGTWCNIRVANPNTLRGLVWLLRVVTHSTRRARRSYYVLLEMVPLCLDPDALICLCFYHFIQNYD